jgi:hypothetical protein
MLSQGPQSTGSRIPLCSKINVTCGAVGARLGLLIPAERFTVTRGHALGAGSAPIDLTSFCTSAVDGFGAAGPFCCACATIGIAANSDIATKSLSFIRASPACTRREHSSGRPARVNRGALNFGKGRTACPALTQRRPLVRVCRGRAGWGRPLLTSAHWAEWRSTEQRVPILWTACHFGGRRPWFRCAVYSTGRYCGRRVAVLYAAGDRFACRHCYGLCYASQQESPQSRFIRRSRRIRMRLGGSPDLLQPFPKRPRGMHQRTYMRLRARDLLLLKASVGALHKRLSR